MTEQKEIILLIYLSEYGDCGLGHFRFLNDLNEAQTIIDTVRIDNSGSIAIVRGLIVEEVMVSEL